MGAVEILRRVIAEEHLEFTYLLLLQYLVVLDGSGGRGVGQPICNMMTKRCISTPP